MVEAGLGGEHYTSSTRWQHVAEEAKEIGKKVRAVRNGAWENTQPPAAKNTANRSEPINAGICTLCGVWFGSLGLEPILDCKRPNGELCSSCYTCVDQDTEILTGQGWKLYSDLRVGDLVAQLDTNAGLLRWGPIRNLHVYNVRDESMVVSKVGKATMSLTANHNVLTVGRPSLQSVGPKNQWRFIQADGLLNQHRIPVVAPWEDGEFAPAPTTEEVELLGWYISDGNRVHRRGARGKRLDTYKEGCLEISQSVRANPDKCDRIRYLLSTLGSNFREYGGSIQRPKILFRAYGEAIQRVLSISPAKQIPVEALHWPKAQVRALLDGLIGGDGTRDRARREVFTQSDKQMCDTVQALYFRLGIAAAITEVRTRSQTKPHFHVYTQSKKIKDAKNVHREKYSGVVWCPETDTHTWVARKNDTPFITGNCHTVVICRALREVLADDGVMYWNVASSYASGDIGTGYYNLRSDLTDVEIEYVLAGLASVAS